MANLTKFNQLPVLPDEILEYQTCTTCKLYLSYGPIKTYPTGEIKCGRCSSSSVGEGVESAYNIFASNLFFPCINRYEGCHDILEYEAVPQHEKTCLKRLYLCPICPIKQFQPKPALFLLDHFKHNHKRLILKNVVMQIHRDTIPKEISLLHIPLMNYLMLISIQKCGDILAVNASTVGDKPELVKQQVKLFGQYPEKNMYSSCWRNCSSWNTNPETFNIVLSSELEAYCLEFDFNFIQKLGKKRTSSTDPNPIPMKFPTSTFGHPTFGPCRSY